MHMQRVTLPLTDNTNTKFSSRKQVLREEQRKRKIWIAK
jgi:hypothetical protein